MILSNMIAKSKLKNKSIDFTIACFLSISLYLSIKTQSKYVWITLSVLFVLRLYKSPKFLLLSLIILVFALLLNMLKSQIPYSGHISGNFIVKEKLSSSVVIEYKGQLIALKSKTPLNLYDQIYVSGVAKPIHNFSDFDFVTYMKSKNIFSEISFGYVKVLSHSNDLRTKVIEYLSSGPDNYKKVAPLILMGKKTFESKPIYDTAFKLSVIHLFVISGFHISLFFVCFRTFLKKIGFKDSYAQIISMVPIGAYLVLLNFPLSATRASLLIILAVINNLVFKKKFKTIDLLGVVMISLFLWNRNGIYSVSFIFTFIATYVIIYLNGFKYKKKWTKFICLALGAYLSNLPISIYLNGFFSIFGLFYSMILSPVFVFIYIISLIFFPIKSMMDYVYGAFIFLLNQLNSINVLVNIKGLNMIFVQSLYTLPLLYLIINTQWNLSEAKKAISSTEKLKS